MTFIFSDFFEVPVVANTLTFEVSPLNVNLNITISSNGILNFCNISSIIVEQNFVVANCPSFEPEEGLAFTLKTNLNLKVTNPKLLFQTK